MSRAAIRLPPATLARCSIGIFLWVFRIRCDSSRCMVQVLKGSTPRGQSSTRPARDRRGQSERSGGETFSNVNSVVC
jgi:hypothetical protein